MTMEEAIQQLDGAEMMVLNREITQSQPSAPNRSRRTNVQSAKAIRSDINKSLYTMILWCLMSCDRCAANLYGVKS